MDISGNVKQSLLKIARLTIASQLGIKMPYSADSIDTSDPIFNKKCGAFVTLHLNGSLRGCIGYIVGIKPLLQAVKDMAYSAAFKDPRFLPLTPAEFEQIDLEISVLSEIEEVTDISQIVVGRDGLIITKNHSSGLLLPQVATENNWDLETFLGHTCLKAGLDVESWKDKSTVIEKFSAEVFGENNEIE
ncbi:MAG: AmmeMemoRadiSam system protein A [Spirochaetes bacterium]|nr:AmmeMemoRadiSam system protein A [Spirochaetota bacterium]MBN2769793.1 AmmeMemoRadiSam system protein A [Spirochaetota bacterium]